MPGLNPAQVQQIHKFIHDQQLLHAIKLYRDATGASLAEARDAVERMARGEAVKPPSGTMDYDNPILDGKIKSLLARQQKVEAIKIYREEYGVGLKQAKDAVDRLEVSMKREGMSAGAPYEPAISGDPFADDTAGMRRIMLLLATVIAIAMCGVAAYLFLAV